MKPSEVAKTCVYIVLPSIGFVFLSIYSWMHMASPDHTKGAECFYRFIVGVDVSIASIGSLILVCWAVYTLFEFIDRKWNEWLDKLDKESGY